MLRGGGLAGLLLLLALPAAAQTAPLLTSNRPGIGDSEALVARGAVQVESGVQAQGEAPLDDVRWAQAWGQLTVRLGLARRIELFTAWDGWSMDRHRAPESPIVTGANDLRVGTKLALTTEDRHGVTVTVSPAWSFPVGTDEFSSGTNDGSVRLLLARSLPRDWSVSGNLLFSRTSDTSGRYWDNLETLALTRALTATVSMFAEAASALRADRPDRWTIDAGMAWVAGPDLQWDLSAGHTFHNRGDDWFVSAGVTLRRR